jgi:pyruvate formate lyase activating enzyme
VRIPLVCDVNDDETNIRQTVQYLYELKNIHSVSLLPYHKGGCEKYIRLRKGESLKNFKPPSRERLGQIKRSFLDAGFNVKIGG